ncbi:hypothetical protein FB451DRAFT_1179963 [Mycena latifolia]|nr:hypothetical protein FB451DRAFT_1179963 [Mycena latifolia]
MPNTYSQYYYTLSQKNIIYLNVVNPYGPPRAVASIRDDPIQTPFPAGHSETSFTVVVNAATLQYTCKRLPCQLKTNRYNGQQEMIHRWEITRVGTTPVKYLLKCNRTTSAFELQAELLQQRVNVASGNHLPNSIAIINLDQRILTPQHLEDIVAIGHVRRMNANTFRTFVTPFA